MCSVRKLQATFALAASCAISVSAWPFLGLGDAIGLDSPYPTHLLAENASTANTTANGSTTAFSPLSVKSVETSLSGIAAILVLVTYGLLIPYSPRLVTGLCVPRKVLSANIRTILERSWPRTGDAAPENRPHLVYISDDSEWGMGDDGQMVFYDFTEATAEERQKLQADARGTLQTSGKRGNLMRGFEEVVRGEHPPSQETNPTVWVQTASSAMKNVVQLAIWEFISLWLVAIMIFNTLLYNGLLGGGTPTNDRWPRLALIALYSVVHVIHFIATWWAVLRVYTLVTLQASWAVLFRLPFTAATDFHKTRSWMKGGSETITFDRYDVDVLGGVTTLERFENVFADSKLEVSRPIESYLGKPEYVGQIETFAAKVKATRILKRLEKVPDEAKVDKNLKAIQDAEVKSFEKATETALERILFNNGLLLSICVATGFAVWTQSLLTDAVASQIGSFALLVSISSALTAICTSATHLSNMLNSAKESLRLTEVAISQLVTERPNRTFYSHHQPFFGFSKQVEEPRRFLAPSIGLHTVWSAVRGPWQLVLSIVFGPAIALLPTSRDHNQPLRLDLQVHNRSFVYWYPYNPQSTDILHMWVSSQPLLFPPGESTLQLRDGYHEDLRKQGAAAYGIVDGSQLDTLPGLFIQLDSLEEEEGQPAASEQDAQQGDVQGPVREESIELDEFNLGRETGEGSRRSSLEITPVRAS